MKRIRDFIVRFKSSLGKSSMVLPDSNLNQKILVTLSRGGVLSYKRLEGLGGLGSFVIKVIKNDIRGLELVSKSSREVFRSYEDLLLDPKLKGPTSFYIMSTSELGICTSWEALEKKVGGKVLLKV